ncbi:MAG: hypothetical protein K940chlam9_00897 [Chlamydiae bacterium]|nr:hypothetical protein [Chlamydiota bacterium]
MYVKSNNISPSPAAEDAGCKGCAGKEWKTGYTISVAIGAILLVSAMFLALAAFQVLPHGVNAISKPHVLFRLMIIPVLVGSGGVLLLLPWSEELEEKIGNIELPGAKACSSKGTSRSFEETARNSDSSEE